MRSPDGVTDDPHGTLKSKSIWMDEDGVGRVKQANTGHASISRWSRVSQADMDGLGDLDFKTTRQTGMTVCASKPGVRPVGEDAGYMAPSRRLR